jgi:hypothetical protein
MKRRSKSASSKSLARAIYQAELQFTPAMLVTFTFRIADALFCLAPEVFVKPAFVTLPYRLQTISDK